jgi:serine/threonine protein kinase
MRDDAPDQPGTAVSGYRVERFVGAGGMASVYEARRLGPGGPGERVACKVMHEERRAEPRDRERIRREAVLGLRITAGHPNLVRVLDYLEDAEERLCIAMELIDGASVAELRGPARPGRCLPFPPAPIVRRIACEVLEALAYLHGQDVLHRDVSPRNILIAMDGAVKLADLGIARVMEGGQVHTMRFHGVPAYASPEAIQFEPLDARSDLFSLGAVLFELVAGTPPAGDLTRDSKIVPRMAFGEHVSLPPDTPADLAELITGLLRTDREARRPQTAAEGVAFLRSSNQPIASPEELAALVAGAKSRRKNMRARERPAKALRRGHVLVSRWVDAPPGHMAGRAGDYVIRFRRHGAGRFLLGRVAPAAAFVACVLMLGLWLQDRLRGERDAVPQRPAEPARIAEPAPAPPVAPVPVTSPPPVAPVVAPARSEIPENTGEPARPRRAATRLDGANRARNQARGRARVEPAPVLREPIPLASEPPPWAMP